jgi:ABC-2 type transport system permease protein
MNALGAAIWIELLKSRRSKVPWLIAVGFSFAALVEGLFMVILKDPEHARQLGLLGAKAQLGAGTADWPSFLHLLAETVGAAATVLFAFLTAWIFGREFADRTVRGLLAIPTPRAAIVVAKLIVLTVWCGAISAWYLVLGMGLGAFVGLPGWSASLALSTLGAIAVAAGMCIALQTTTAFMASVGRGYIPPLGWTVLVMALAQVLGALGWAAWFPWAVPLLVVGAAGPAGEAPTAASIVVVVLAALLGLVANVVWWERADQTG